MLSKKISYPLPKWASRGECVAVRTTQGVRCSARDFRRIVGLIALTASFYLPAPAASADDSQSVDATTPVAEESWAGHGQATFVDQESDGFHAPYAGSNSLSPARGRETVDVTLSLGARLWSGAEIWVTPEIDQGFGLDNTLGVAGFPSGEAYKVGANHPYFRLPRAFVRQTIDLGGDRDDVRAGANQLAGSITGDRWVLTIGKFGVTDIFDTNQYAHDPRSDFLNWAAVDAGSFDYAADSWGYTVGLAAELYLGPWAIRAGVFDLSNVPNSENLEHGLHEFQMNGEIERRYQLLGQTGRLLITAFESRGRMALLDQAIAQSQRTGAPPNPTDLRSYRGRFGLSLALEQPLTSEVGLFARAGKATGNVEAYEFTDIDRSISIGASIKGGGWNRAGDVVGLAAIDNGISAEREAYLNLGGLGILVGDGKLPHPAAEQIIESYYKFTAFSWLALSLDYQWVKNPAYNTDRGPVSIFALRVHMQF